MKKNISRRGGFTLLEMAVILVIIGLIIGAVSIGKDLQRGAEYKKIKQKFVDQWAVAYNAYYEKYGVVIGDSEADPTMVVGGAGSATFGGGSGYGTGGAKLMTATTPPKMVCEPLVTGGLALHGFFDNAGVRMPPGRAEGLEDRYVYLDSNGNPMEIQVCFQWNRPGTTSGSGNMMVLQGLTPDLARMLDQMIDGKADACEGVFRESGATCTGSAIWGSDNTTKFGAADTANLDENQIAVVTAHYKMNQ